MNNIRDSLKKRNDKRHLITSALPYVNNEPHLGNLIQVLSADVFARFSRLKGYDTFYACGTDEYGTATEMRAAESGKSEYQLCSEYFAIHKKIYDWFNISFDIFSRTTEAIHTKLTQEVFRKCYENGYIVTLKEQQYFCPNCNKFLSDRFVEGICPNCGGTANVDQCENCGQLLEGEGLINPHCKICGARPTLKETENLALDLPKLEPRIKEAIVLAKRENRYSQNAIAIANSWLMDGLRPKTITRDLKWGIKVPKKGFESKVFYVWFDACIGYISLTAMARDDWRDWWINPNKVLLYQFIGKDNIPFHTIMFPATEIASGLNWTPLYILNASEYLNFESGKFSKSKNTGIFGSDCIESGIDSDIWRFYLNYIRPEKQDSDFSFFDFENTVNSQLVGNFSNLVNRALVFIKKEYNGRIPISKIDVDFYDSTVRQLIYRIDNLLENTKLKDAFLTIFELCDALNKYFQTNEPWKLKDSNKKRCDIVIRTLITGVKDVCILMSFYLPKASKKFFDFIGIKTSYDDLGEDIYWDNANEIVSDLHLFERIDKKVLAELKRKTCPNADVAVDKNKKNKK